MSLDGYVAGADQSIDDPLGKGGEALHEWAVATRSFREQHDLDGGEATADDEQVAAWHENVGATIMGRNMFGPVRGPWQNEEWRGWWGEDPPFHTPVFVLTHHARPPLEMEGGTTFHFVTDGIESALERAVAAAEGKDVTIGGGASTAQQYLRADFVDELTVHVVPVLLGGGERLFDHLDGSPVGLEPARARGLAGGGALPLLPHGLDGLVVTVDDVRSFASTLPRAYEVVVRGRLKFRVGRIVFLSFSHDETLMGFGFPREWREALVASEPEKFMLPRASDLRFNWAVVRLGTIDDAEMRELVLDAWELVVPQKVSAAYREPA